MFELSATCFFFDVTATTEIYPYRHTPSLLDALPIASPLRPAAARRPAPGGGRRARRLKRPRTPDRADQCPCFSRPRSSFVERDADDVVAGGAVRIGAVRRAVVLRRAVGGRARDRDAAPLRLRRRADRSEEHTS